MIRMKTLILAVVALGLAAPMAVAEDDVKLRMGGDAGQELQIAPGVQLKDGGRSHPHIQIIEIAPEKKPFDEVKSDLQEAVDNYLGILDNAEARQKLDDLRASSSRLASREAEFKALAVKDEAVIETWKQTLFDDFDAHRKLVAEATAFEASASEPVNRVFFTAHENDLAAGRAQVTEILKPTAEINQVWEAVLGEAQGIVNFVIQDSTPIYNGLRSQGETHSVETSDKALKIYFGIMLERWSQ